MIDYGYGITLERINVRYLEGLYTWRNDPEIKKWTRQYDDLSWEEHVAWFDSISKDSSIKMYAVCNGGFVIGVCGLTSIDRHNRRAEFSLYIAPKEGGKGHGKAALKTLLHHGFKCFGLNTIWGETFDANPAAKLFESLNFTLSGTKREAYWRDGEFIDARYYDMTAGDFDDADWANG